MPTKKAGLKKDGTLKKGYKFAKGGRVIKTSIKDKLAGVVKATTKYAKGSKSKAASDAKRGAMKPGYRISKNGKLYRETRKNRSDL